MSTREVSIKGYWRHLECHRNLRRGSHKNITQWCNTEDLFAKWNVYRWWKAISIISHKHRHAHILYWTCDHWPMPGPGKPWAQTWGNRTLIPVDQDVSTGSWPGFTSSSSSLGSSFSTALHSPGGILFTQQDYCFHCSLLSNLDGQHTLPMSAIDHVTLGHSLPIWSKSASVITWFTDELHGCKVINSSSVLVCFFPGNI